MSDQYQIDTLSNGYVRVHDRFSGLSGVWNPDGTPRHGELTRSIYAGRIRRLVLEHLSRKG